MCDIWKETEQHEITPAQLERELTSISALRVEWVVLSGGEPLMHSDLFRLCRILRDHGVRVTVLSTGLLLARYARRIVEHIDDVIVSLDGPLEIHNRIRRVPNAFERLEAGIREIRAVKSDYPIAARCTVQSLNCTHLQATVSTARELRLDSISFLAADVVSTAFNRPGGWSSDRQAAIAVTETELNALETEIEAIIDNKECGDFVLESPDKLRRIVHHFRSQLGLRHPVAPLCNAPWVSAVVEANGTVKPCFFQPAIGMLTPQTTLLDILNGPAAVAFRSSLDVASNPICRRCVCSLNWKPDGIKDSEGIPATRATGM
jgi:MoaA/NifB/PqqE/SkfB family radical SAM enzyme